MDHRIWLAKLPDQVKSRLAVRSDRAGLVHMAGHVGLIAACSALIVSGVPGWWLLLPVQGVLLVFLGPMEALLHGLMLTVKRLLSLKH